MVFFLIKTPLTHETMKIKPKNVVNLLKGLKVRVFSYARRFRWKCINI